MPVLLDAAAVLAARIESEYGYAVKLCAEGEFLLSGIQKLTDPDDFWRDVLSLAQHGEVPLESIGKESVSHSSIEQYEYRLRFTDPLSAIQHVGAMRHALETVAVRYEVILSFDAYYEGIASGLHWHLHLETPDGKPVFIKQNEKLSTALAHTIGGLLETMSALMPCFASTDAAYYRLQSALDHVPSTVSWGNNNRTVALRLPESVIPLRHIEHRLCAADSNEVAALWALLVGVHYGLSHQPDPGPQMFGDANHNQYGLARLPLIHADALKAMQSADWISDYIELPVLISALDDAAGK